MNAPPPTSISTGPDTDVSGWHRTRNKARAEMREAVPTEFRDWDTNVPSRRHPDPRDPGGLPSGWVLAARHEFLLWGAVETVLGLVRREAGGWVLVHHTPRHEYTKVDEFAASISDLWLIVQEHPTWRALREPLRDLVVTAYDPQDPTEAAERTLMALGGPLTHVPSALSR